MKGLVSSQPLLSFSHLRHDSRVNISSHSLISVLKPQHQPPTSAPFITLSSSSSSIVEEQDPLPSSPSPLLDSIDDDSDPRPFSGCKACGREEIERGCNGEGRIQGGIATIPGFGWWPIKAYRPCPGFVASGGNYRRRGQSMDEVAFGGGKQGSSVDDFDDLGTRKKGKSRRTFKS